MNYSEANIFVLACGNGILSVYGMRNAFEKFVNLCTIVDS